MMRRSAPRRRCVAGSAIQHGLSSLERAPLPNELSKFGEHVWRFGISADRCRGDHPSKPLAPPPDGPDVRQVMVTPMIHTTAAKRVEVSSSSIEIPTARTAALVDGHAVLAPTRWSSDA